MASKTSRLVKRDEAWQGQIADAYVTRTYKKHVRDFVNQQASADNLITTAQSGRFQIDNDRYRRPRQCLSTPARIVRYLDHFLPSLPAFFEDDVTCAGVAGWACAASTSPITSSS